MKTRCKFKCMNVTPMGTESEPGYQVRFEAVINGSPENEAFFRWTPSGTLTIGLAKENLFETGKEYYLDIVPCDEAQEA